MSAAAVPAQAAAASHSAASQQQQQSSGKLAAVVVAPEYCLAAKTKLIMQPPESFGTERGKEYHISDTTGKTYFMLKATGGSSLTGSSSKRQLFDAHGKPLIDVEKKVVSMHGTWMLKRTSDGTRLAEIKPDWAMFKSAMQVYLNDGDKQPDFVITGSKAFVIKDCHRDAVVAKLRKGSAIPCIKPKTAAEAGKYTLKIMPGVDAAFITALAMVCEEVRGKKAA